MTTERQNIRKLIPVLDMAFQAEQVKMATIARRIAELRQQLIDLERPESFDPLSIATRMGADVLWETWVQERKALIVQELAIAMRDRDGQRGNLVAALSKVEAAKQMDKRATMEAKQQASRRSSW